MVEVFHYLFTTLLPHFWGFCMLLEATFQYYLANMMRIVSLSSDTSLICC